MELIFDVIEDSINLENVEETPKYLKPQDTE
jgi:hypothetical protein